MSQRRASSMRRCGTGLSRLSSVRPGGRWLQGEELDFPDVPRVLRFDAGHGGGSRTRLVCQPRASISRENRGITRKPGFPESVSAFVSHGRLRRSVGKVWADAEPLFARTASLGRRGRSGQSRPRSVWSLLCGLRAARSALSPATRPSDHDRPSPRRPILSLRLVMSMSFMLAALRVLHIDIPGARPWLAAYRTHVPPMTFHQQPLLARHFAAPPASHADCRPKTDDEPPRTDRRTTTLGRGNATSAEVSVNLGADARTSPAVVLTSSTGRAA